MRSNVSGSSCFVSSSPCASSNAAFRGTSLFVALVLLAVVAFAGPALTAQALSRITQAVDTSQAEALPNHHPSWASAANSTGLAPADLSLNQITLVLARSAQQEAAFKQFLADQQNPASPDYHHWLTPSEVGQRFGLSDQDIATISSWLQSQGLHVNWVAPSRIFIGFSGTAADVGRAFQTELHTYSVNGQQRFAVSSNPMVPAALAPAIKAIRGLYTLNERPAHHTNAAQSVSPQITASDGTTHFIGPKDFATIYDIPSSYNGLGTTIGIVSWSRTNSADFANFRDKTGISFGNPTEVVPTTYGGIDPGPALTAPPSGSSSVLAGQEEATLDVTRAGSVAPGASLLLVVSSASGANDGIGADAQYLVGTTPVPAQVMSISFGACESEAGASAVAFWDSLFQAAVAEGISVFVSSGDSGASGCDTNFVAPPASPAANSPNYICSSSYATCVGGTEFADTASPSTYWSSSNGYGYLSALGYIPEGAWNESTSTYVAATGGGVSSVITPTPSWQTATGVPAARAGRYTPDVSFSASAHDGYFACLAALNGSCVTSGGTFGFIIFSGTSAAAPDMAGVAALLNQKMGAPQGNINPHLYSLAASSPLAFHDATVSSSGVSSCSTSTASICNNSIPLASGSGAQAGYALTTGYDQATGLGSLDVTVFLSNYGAVSTLPVATTGTASTISTTSATLNASVNPSGLDTQVWFLYGTSSSLSGASQTTSQDLGSGTAATAASANLAGLTSGTTYYFQVVAQNSTGASYGNIGSFITSSASKTTPTITWATPAAITYGTPLSATQLNATASVPGTFVYSPVADTVLPAGAQTLGVTFTPTDTTNYNAASGTVTLTVNKATPTVTWATPLAITYGIALSATQLNATASVAGTFVYSPAAGTVLAVGPQTLGVTFTPTDTTDYTTAIGSVTLTVNKATPTLTWATPAAITYGTALSATQLNATASVPGTFVYSPASGAVLTAGLQTIFVTFTPTDTTTYSNAITTVTLTVNKATPTITWATPTGISYGTALSATQLNATASVAGTFVYTPAAGAVLTAGSQILSVTFAPTDITNYTAATGTVTLAVSKATPTVTWAAPAAITYGTALSATQLNATASVPGAFVYSPVAGTILAVGSQALSVTFTPTDATDYTIATGGVTLTVNKATPVITWATPSSVVVGTVLSATQLNATANTAGTFVYTPAAGAVMSTVGATTLSTTFTPTDTINYNSPATSSVTLTVTALVPSFTVAGTAATVASPGATGTSTITVTPVNAFTGSVTLTAAIASSPSGAQYPPTLSFGTSSPVSITSTAGTATLTVSTTAATSASLAYPKHNGWYAGGGAVLACLLLFCVPSGRRNWRNLLGMIALLFVLAGGAVACGGGSSSGGGSTGTSGTTLGTYTITVTATSGSTTATNTIALTVN